VSCTIYSTSGQASTTVREYTFLGNILTGGDFLAFGVMIGLALMTFIFSFIASNSKTEGWTKVWIMFTLFFSCMTMLSIAYFSEQDGETAILEITMWIFYILLMLFMIITLIFLYSSVIGFLLKAFEMMTTRRWKH
jgi:Ca2+/Na+ antiporter